ncbi:MAG TPA: ABC transporter ATP-binding protein, partial [Nitrososphaeraceae archaeon]
GGDVIKIKTSLNSKSNLTLSTLKNFNFVHKVEFSDDGSIIISVSDAIHNIPAILKDATNIASAEYHTPTLNDVFLQLTGRHISKEDHAEGGFMERYAQYGQ